MTEAVEYPDLVVVGAGLFGLTVAQQAVERLGVRVEIIDVRDHIGGNAYSYMDEETGAEIHKYGAHLFHTSNKRVWDYVNRFTSFTNYVHRVYATHDGEVYPLPINLAPSTSSSARTTRPPKPSARGRAGRRAGGQGSPEPQRQGHFADRPPPVRGVHQELHGQAVADRSEGPASGHHQPPAGALQLRQPLFQGHVEGLPADGYTAWMERMIDDPRIHVTLETDFFDESQPYNKAALAAAGVPVVYTGPVDRYFDYSLGELKWRTVDFKEVRYDEGDHFAAR